MFQIPQKGTVRWELYSLIDKRNTQFAAVFRKIRDAYTILQAFMAIHVVYKKYFDSVQKADQWLKVLMWVYNKDHRLFYMSDLYDVLNLNKHQIKCILISMGKRGLLNSIRSRGMYMYTLTPEAHLLLQNFSKECLTAIMAIVRDGRKGKKHKKI